MKHEVPIRTERGGDWNHRNKHTGRCGQKKIKKKDLQGYSLSSQLNSIINRFSGSSEKTETSSVPE